METDHEHIKGATLNFLSQSKNITAALATVSADGMPHCAVVYFAAEDDFSFYFLTATDTRKYKDLTENLKASLSFGFGPAYVTVQAEGEVVLLEKGSEAENFAIARIKNRLVENDVTWPIFQLSDYDDNAIAAFKFTPSRLTYLNLDPQSALPVTGKRLQRVI